MKNRTLRIALLAAATAAVSTGVLAHVRLISPTNGQALYWNTPTNIGIVLNSTGSDDIADDSAEIALRMAIDEWNGVSGSRGTLVEDTTPAEQARTDWTATDLHLIMSDENNSSGFFPGGSSTVAITPILFNSISGVILDADILFNGLGFDFTTSATPSDFDVQDVGTHELGHLLGLDHSGAAGSTMYPYVDPTVILHRSVSGDEAQGMRDAYPDGSFGRITGTIQRLADDSAIEGALVVASDADGRTFTSILTRANGAFTLKGLDPGTYAVFVRPLDEPVGSANLGQGFTIETDFEPQVYPAPAVVVGTGTAALGVLKVDADVALNLGTNADPFPLRVTDGATTSVTLHGTGLVAGSTHTVSDTDITLGPPSWSGTQVSVNVTVPDGEAIGHVDLTVTDSSGDVSILPAALEVTPPSPTVVTTVPGSGSTFGGTPLTITGTEFHAGARIVIGDQIYTDGVGSTSVDNSTTITLVTATRRRSPSLPPRPWPGRTTSSSTTRAGWRGGWPPASSSPPSRRSPRSSLRPAMPAAGRRSRSRVRTSRPVSRSASTAWTRPGSCWTARIG